MPFPTKDYHRLKSLQKRWGVSQEDIFYAIESGILRVCVWLPMRYVERCVVLPPYNGSKLRVRV